MTVKPIYNEGYFGFIYIWRDRKRKMYYVGSHKGAIDDGYVCSSKTMKQAYSRRPGDFKRRILEYVELNNDTALYSRELKWLSLVKAEELQKRYYNKSKNTCGHEHRWTSEEKRAAHSAKMKAKWADPEWKNRPDRSADNRKAWENDPERRARQSELKKGPRSVETRAKMSESAKKRLTPEWAAKQGALMRAKRFEKLGY